MATKYWNSQTGQWVAGSFSDGILPAANDTVIADGRSSKSFITSLDRTGDTAGAGLNLVKFETTEDFIGDIGTPDQPLKLTADVFIHRGRGKLYFVSATGSGALNTDRLILDTPNLNHEVTIGNYVGSTKIVELSLLRGRAYYLGVVATDRIFIGYSENAITDAYLRTQDGFILKDVIQYGGQFIYNCINVAVTDRMIIAGGYCQFNGSWSSGQFIQTGGLVEFPMRAIPGISPQGLITTAFLLGGTMDTTKMTLGQTITTAYIAPTMDLMEDGKLTITNRINLWE